MRSSAIADSAFNIHFECSPAGNILVKAESLSGTAQNELGDMPQPVTKTLLEDPLGHLLVRDASELGGAARARDQTGHRDIHRKRAPLPRSLSVEELGATLFDALFSEPIRRLFATNLEAQLTRPEGNLDLRLHFDLNDPRQATLATLPWEFLYWKERDLFLSHSTRTPIVRCLDVPNRVTRFDLPPRLHILLVASAPKDLAPLGLEAELDLVRDSWSQDNVEISVLQRDGATDLGTLLREELRRNPYHVLHFMGHGTFDTESREGSIFFETAKRRAQAVTGRQFAKWLINHNSLRLVVLNACSTGQSQTQQPFSGVAPALTQAGIPGVLAMQLPMPDTLAIEFSRVLYQSLASGTAVESAVSQARLELHALRPDSRAWAIPVLFARQPEIIRVPPKVGPALSRVWTLLGCAHLLVMGLMFLRNRSVMPIYFSLRETIQGDVAAFIGVHVGLPILYSLLYVTYEYGKNADLPRDFSSSNRLRRLALRLPVAFGARVQGRRLTETTYQLSFLFAFMILPMILHGYLYGRLMKAPVFLRKPSKVFSSGWIPPIAYTPSLDADDTQDFPQGVSEERSELPVETPPVTTALGPTVFFMSGWENFVLYVPPGAAFFDRFRMGSVDDRPCIEKDINNVTYFPFWGPWGLLFLETGAICWFLIIVLRISNADRQLQHVSRR